MRVKQVTVSDLDTEDPSTASLAQLQSNPLQFGL